uniref:Uncharacterized protein n=1 Tax=Arundo donax TaxID=35708 RepID=A0A0A9IHF8_ARUDO
MISFLATVNSINIFHHILQTFTQTPMTQKSTIGEYNICCGGMI